MNLILQYVKTWGSDKSSTRLSITFSMVFQNVKAELCYLDYIFQKTSLCLVSITFYFLTFFLSWHGRGGSANFCHFQSLFFFSLLFLFYIFHCYTYSFCFMIRSVLTVFYLWMLAASWPVRAAESWAGEGLWSVVTVEEVVGSSRKAGRLWEPWVCLKYE